jgi:hypothetical protein
MVVARSGSRLLPSSMISAEEDVNGDGEEAISGRGKIRKGFCRAKKQTKYMNVIPKQHSIVYRYYTNSYKHEWACLAYRPKFTRFKSRLCNF